MSIGFELAIEAVRFVLAGGTYVPAECLLSAIPTRSRPIAPGYERGYQSRTRGCKGDPTGKSNKIIAYDLNMCESTVKVHVRHIMKKLQAKNRTDVAIKAANGRTHQARMRLNNSVVSVCGIHSSFTFP